MHDIREYENKLVHSINKINELEIAELYIGVKTGMYSRTDFRDFWSIQKINAR